MPPDYLVCKKTNGFNFAVVDNTMVTKLAVLEDIEVTKDGRSETEMVSL